MSIWVKELFKVYQGWCKENDERAASERFFGLHLKEISFEHTRMTDARFWSGLVLRA
jgi:putative DNA primase/helicase